MLAGHNRKTRTVTETGEHAERPPHDAPDRTNAPTVGAAVDPNLPVHIREQIAAVVDASGDLERVPTGSGALTVQVCSASETSYDAATWSTLGTYRAADAATLAERLLDALGDSANIGTDLGVLIVTHTHTDTLEAPAMTAPTADGTRAPAAPLLTLDLAKADVLDDDFEWPEPGSAQALWTPHWLLQAAINSGAVTYDRRLWGELALSAEFTAPNRHELQFVITYEIDGAPNIVDGDTTDYPADFNELSDEEQNAVPSTLVPNPETAASWLTYLVAAFNAVHASTDQLVRGWPHQ
ncbi:hypothetical protein A3L23_05190 (plasmid) [Rhodococcoides fascians D188]|nr:hypothetical protein A3L23_05190 [Rhodococcus fascians D188]